MLNFITILLYYLHMKSKFLKLKLTSSLVDFLKLYLDSSHCYSNSFLHGIIQGIIWTKKKTFPPISIEHAQNLHLYSKFAIQKSKSDLCMFFLPWCLLSVFSATSYLRKMWANILKKVFQKFEWMKMCINWFSKVIEIFQKVMSSNTNN